MTCHRGLRAYCLDMSVLKPHLSGRVWASILGGRFILAYSHLCKVSSYCGGVLTFMFDTPYYGDTLQGGCIITLLLRDRTPYSSPPKSGMTIWHLPPPERGYPPGRGGDKLAYTFFTIYSERCQRPFWLKIFLYISCEIYFSEKSEANLLENYFLALCSAQNFLA